MTYDIPPAAAEILRAWASHFQSSRTPEYGMAAVGLELDYGKGGAAAAARAVDMALSRLRMPSGRFERMLYLVRTTSFSTWGQLGLVFPSAEWSALCRAVDRMMDADPDPDARRVAVPKIRRGRPIESHRINPPGTAVS